MSEDEAPAWFTEAQRGTWKAGDDVIVTLGECHIGGHHGTEEISARGIVIWTDGPGDHPIMVYFRHPLGGSQGDGQGRFGWTYAAGELRPDDTLAQILKEHAVR